MLRGFAMQVGAIGVGHDQAGLGRENLARQILREGKEQPVAMRAIASAVSDWRPFGAGTRWTWRACDSMAASIERRQQKRNGFARRGPRGNPSNTLPLIRRPLQTMGGPTGTAPGMID